MLWLLYTQASCLALGSKVKARVFGYWAPGGGLRRTLGCSEGQGVGAAVHLLHLYLCSPLRSTPRGWGRGSVATYCRWAGLNTLTTPSAQPQNRKSSLATRQLADAVWRSEVLPLGLVHMHRCALVPLLTLRLTQASSCRLLLNRHSRPELVMQKVLRAAGPRPHATPQKTLFLWSPSNPERPMRGTALLTCRQAEGGEQE